MNHGLNKADLYQLLWSVAEECERVETVNQLKIWVGDVLNDVTDTADGRMLLPSGNESSLSFVEYVSDMEIYSMLSEYVYVHRARTTDAEWQIVLDIRAEGKLTRLCYGAKEKDIFLLCFPYVAYDFPNVATSIDYTPEVVNSPYWDETAAAWSQKARAMLQQGFPYSPHPGGKIQL